MLSITLGQIESMLGQYLWPLIRILALLMSAPVFAHQTIPAQVKIAAALAMTLVIAPGLPQPLAAVFGAEGWWLVAEQILVGVAIGWLMYPFSR